MSGCFLRKSAPPRQCGLHVGIAAKKLTMNAVTVAQNTASVGENPMTMKITIETSEKKWYQ